jgi:N-methylhydantoinase A
VTSAANAAMHSPRPVRCAVDTGGTFTDLAVLSDDGSVRLHKHSSTPEDPAAGILGALALAATADGRALADFLGDVDTLVYGTTRATNAVLTDTTAKTALLVTKGHPDTLLFREGGRPDPFNWSYDYPDPYIPRSLTYEVPERIGAGGEVVIPMDEAAVHGILETLQEQDVEAIAVCLLWSIANPEHERRIGELITKSALGIPFTLSHELNPTLREYRRASSTAIDASLKPLMGAHLSDISARLGEAGFKGRLLVISTAGGLMDPSDMAAAPIHSIHSGPAVAPVAGRYFGSQDVSSGTLIVADTGGTSFDVTVVHRGEIPMTRETWLGRRHIGHITGFPAVGVHSIGAGGGSIARVDSAGMLHVGPESAGAVPGPAAYGRGGDEATVTDAAVVLGYLDPDYFLAGKMKLDRRLAETALARHVAEPLGLSVEQAALAVLTLATEHMVQAISQMTVGQGVDPRHAVLVGGGGAAGLNAAAIANRLGCRGVLIPEVSPALSAVGGLLLGLMAEFSAAVFLRSDGFDFARARETLEALSAQCIDFVDRAGIGHDAVEVSFKSEARYAHQVWEIDVPLNGNRFAEPEDVIAFCDHFRARHEEIYAVRDERSPVYILGLRARVVSRTDEELDLRSTGPPDGAPARSVRQRAMHFASAGQVTAPVVELRHMGSDDRISGPAVVEAEFTTIVVEPDMTARRLPSGSLLIEADSLSSDVQLSA